MESKLILRGPRIGDMVDIRELRKKFHNDGFEFPDGTQIIADAVVETEGKVIAYGRS
jgi:hypothetical protein